MPRTTPRLFSSLVALLCVGGCSGSLTEPARVKPGDATPVIAISCQKWTPECADLPPTGWYDPPMYVGVQTDITAQDAFAATWMNSAEFRDTLPGVVIDAYAPGELYCATNGYVNQYNGQISPNCPTGPCYEQWKGMRNAGVAWTTLVNGYLMGAQAIRNAWGLFTLSLPSSTGAFMAWGNLDSSRQKYVMCMSQDNNWTFYNPATWNDPNPYTRPRYPNGMPR